MKAAYALTSENILMPPNILSEPGLTQEIPSSTPDLEFPTASETTMTRMVNSIFVTSTSPNTSTTDLPVQFTTIVLHLAPSPNFPIDSNFILLTQTGHIKNLLDVTEDDRIGFANAKQEEISFLLRQSVAVVPKDSICPKAELQPLRWILVLKLSGNPKLKPRYRARLVSASHRSKYRHAVHGNAPTVALSTMRTFFALLPLWIQSSRSDPLHVFTRDVTKAYLHSDLSKRLIYYRPQSEFFEAFPQYFSHVWKAKEQLYDDVEARLYWHKTFVP